jgi:hypothetical protein
MPIKVRRPRLVEHCQCHQLDLVQWKDKEGVQSEKRVQFDKAEACFSDFAKF